MRADRGAGPWVGSRLVRVVHRQMVLQESAGWSFGGRGRTIRKLRSALHRVPPMLGASARELATMPTIAMLAGDWPTAEEAARARLARKPADEGGLVALAVSLWEMGREEQARAVIMGANGAREPSHLRAAVRFFHHIDEPDSAQVAIDALAARAGSRDRGRPCLAAPRGVHAGSRRGGSRAGGNARQQCRLVPASRALAEQRVVSGEWRANARPRPIEPCRAPSCTCSSARFPSIAAARRTGPTTPSSRSGLSGSSPMS